MGFVVVRFVLLLSATFMVAVHSFSYCFWQITVCYLFAWSSMSRSGPLMLVFGSDRIHV